MVSGVVLSVISLCMSVLSLVMSLIRLYYVYYDDRK